MSKNRKPLGPKPSERKAKRSWLSGQDARTQFVFSLIHEDAMNAVRKMGLNDHEIDRANRYGKDRYGVDMGSPAASAFAQLFDCVGICELEIGETFLLNPHMEIPVIQEYGVEAFDSALTEIGAFSRYVRPVTDWDRQESGGIGLTTSGVIGKTPNYILVTSTEESETYDTQAIWIDPDNIRHLAGAG